MDLQSFRIWDFRSINDSGSIDVSQITALLGRNESGKSNLLLALKSLNPVEGFEKLKPIKDFPRHRKITECNDETKAVASVWNLTGDEQSQLVDIFPRSKGVTKVEIGRNYGVKRWVNFHELEDQKFDEKNIKGTIRKIVPAVKAAAGKLEDPHKTQLDQVAEQFDTNISLESNGTEWAKKATMTLPSSRIL